MKLPLNIKTLKDCLAKAFKALDLIKGHEMIVAIGNTGCGKSTMLTSLVFGPAALEEREIINEIEIKKNGKVIKTKKKKTTVID